MDGKSVEKSDGDLARLINESYSQYMQNGFVNYLVSHGALSLKFAGIGLRLTGSTADGSKLDASDIDVMFYPNTIVLDETTFEYKSVTPCYFRIPIDNVTSELHAYKTDDGKYLNGNLLKQIPPKIYKQLSIVKLALQKFGRLQLSKVGFAHFGQSLGQTQRDTNDETSSEIHSHLADFVPAFRISGTPKYVNAWVRRRREWPPSCVVESILAGEFHAVAKVSPIDGDDTKDFCLSFTVAENKLMGSLSEQQLLCLRVIKVLKPAMQFPPSSAVADYSSVCGNNVCHGADSLVLKAECEVITSYNLKTAFFWFLENTDVSFWTEKDTIECVRMILRYFHSCIIQRRLPHYFIPSMNLFTGIPDQNFSLPSVLTEEIIDETINLCNIVADCQNNECDGKQSATVPKRKYKFCADSFAEMLELMIQIGEETIEDEITVEEQAMASESQSVLELAKEFVYPLLESNIKQETFVGHEDLFHTFTDFYSGIIMTNTEEEFPIEEMKDKLSHMIYSFISTQTEDEHFLHSLREYCKLVFQSGRTGSLDKRLGNGSVNNDRSVDEPLTRLTAQDVEERESICFEGSISHEDKGTRSTSDEGSQPNCDDDEESDESSVGLILTKFMDILDSVKEKVTEEDEKKSVGRFCGAFTEMGKFMELSKGDEGADSSLDGLKEFKAASAKMFSCFEDKDGEDLVNDKMKEADIDLD